MSNGPSHSSVAQLISSCLEVRRVGVRSGELAAVKALCLADPDWPKQFRNHEDWVDRALKRLEAGQMIFGVYGPPVDRGKVAPELIGCVFLRKAMYHNSAELKCLCVRGGIKDLAIFDLIANLLITKSIDFAEANEIDRLEMEVPQSHHLISLLNPRGFHPVSTRQKYFAGRNDCILERVTGNCYRGDPFNMLKIGKWLFKSILSSSLTSQSVQEDNLSNVFFDFEPSPQRSPFAHGDVGYEHRVKGRLAVVQDQNDEATALGICENFDSSHMIRLIVCRELNEKALDVYSRNHAKVFTVADLRRISGEKSSLKIPFDADEVGGVITVLDRETIEKLNEKPKFVYYLLSGIGEALMAMKSSMLLFYCPFWFDGGSGIVGYANIRKIPTSDRIDRISSAFSGDPRLLDDKQLSVYAASIGADVKVFALSCGKAKLFKNVLHFDDNRWLGSSATSVYYKREVSSGLANCCYIDKQSGAKLTGVKQDEFSSESKFTRQYAVSLFYAPADHARIEPIVFSLVREFGEGRVFTRMLHREKVSGPSASTMFEAIPGKSDLLVFFSTIEFSLDNWCIQIWRTVLNYLFMGQMHDSLLMFKDKEAPNLEDWRSVYIAEDFDKTPPRVISKLIVNKWKLIKSSQGKGKSGM